MTIAIDRSVAPPLRNIETIPLPRVDEYPLRNSVPMYVIHSGNQEVLKIELLFDAGRRSEPMRAIASTANKMLLEGTRNKTAQQIAEAIDFYGASIHTDATIDYAAITIYALNKHIDYMLPLLYEVIYESNFPERELTTYIQNSKQRLMVNLQKVDFLAQKAFNEKLYGHNHPNGYTTAADDYNAVTSSVLTSFHESQYHYGLKKIFVAGNAENGVLEKIDHFFGSFPVQPSTNNQWKLLELPSSGKMFSPKKDAVQSGIRIGKLLVNKVHPDYVPLRVLNTVLGGYFGSRLMQNLREEHGYCYGVHSSIASYVHDGHLYITTEVGDAVTWNAVDEIYREVNRLRTELISEEELTLVKHYMLGVFLADADGPFNVSDIVRGLRVYDLDESFFHAMIEKIKTVTPEELLQMAVKYLDPASMLEVVIGNNPGTKD